MNTIPALKVTLLVIGLLTSGLTFAHGAGAIDPASVPTPVALIYTNAAYSHAIHGAPNAAREILVGQVNPVYVSQAQGPAIYSYASSAAVEARVICER